MGNNDACTGDDGKAGVCYTAAQCTSMGGSATGNCAMGFGVCCRILVDPTCPSDITTCLPRLSTPATPTMSTLQPPVVVLRLQGVQEEWLQEYSSPQPQPQRQPHQRASPMWRFREPTQCTDGRSTRRPPRSSRSGLTLSSLTSLHQLLEAARMNR